MLFVFIMTMLFMGTLFFMLNRIFNDLDQRVKVLETRCAEKGAENG
jgi:hypothetical protein